MVTTMENEKEASNPDLFRAQTMSVLFPFSYRPFLPINDEFSAIRFHNQLRDAHAKMRSIQSKKIKRGKSRGDLKSRDYNPNGMHPAGNFSVLPEVKRSILVLNIAISVF